ncbi:MAG: thioredoxin fold domain-containing protein [Gammaproteobacteria bacterium]|nr:thioredoxin fold domain-containing protein [Gammaproteobacteria bacterium]
MNSKQPLYVALFFSLFVLFAAEVKAAQPGTLDSGMVNPGYEEKPDWFKLSFLDIREDVEEATAEGKRVLLYFYQDGCPYCAKLIRDNFSQRAISEKTQKHFDVIAINMWGDKEVTDINGNETIEKEFAKSLRVMFTPTLLFLDEQGKIALRVNGYYFPEKFSAALDYVAQKMETKTGFGAYYRSKSPAPATGKLHADPSYLKSPYDLTSAARNSKKHLLVLLEQKKCKACDELHQDIFQRKRTKSNLEKLDVVLLNVHSRDTLITPDGKKNKIYEWVKELNTKYVPSMVYFDASGKEVFRAEAYLKAFHVQGSMSYVFSEAYKTQPSFQRYLSGVADKIQEQGQDLDLME